MEFMDNERKDKHRFSGVVLAMSLCFILGAFMGFMFNGDRLYNNDRVQNLQTSNLKSRERSRDRVKRSTCGLSTAATPSGHMFLKRFMERQNKLYACVRTKEDCLNAGLPRNYIAYHLSGEEIKLDGKLDEHTWKEVPWSDTFLDIRSKVYPKPFYDTKFKMRWDDKNLYIGVYLQEKQLWATHKTHDARIWEENALDFLIAVDGSMYNYKQLQVNALGTIMDLLMYKSYWDAPGQVTYDVGWRSFAKVAVHADGTMNSPHDEDRFWSVEISVPFKQLVDRSERPHPLPNENEVWFLQFGRVEYKLDVKNGNYVKSPNSTVTWWAWQPCDAVNLHLQDRWGLVQFRTNKLDDVFRFDDWHIYKTLFSVMDAMKHYKTRNGEYTTAIEELDLPPYLLSRTCVDIPEVELITAANGTVIDFKVTVRSRLFRNRPPASIRSDRHVFIR